MVRGEAIQSELYRRNMGPQARLAYKPDTPDSDGYSLNTDNDDIFNNGKAVDP